MAEAVSDDKHLETIEVETDIKLSQITAALQSVKLQVKSEENPSSDDEQIDGSSEAEDLSKSLEAVAAGPATESIESSVEQLPKNNGDEAQLKCPASTKVAESQENQAPVIEENKSCRSDSMSSIVSRTSMLPRHKLHASSHSVERYFCCKDDAIEKAVEKVTEAVYNAQLDGIVKGAWLLTEIDHWDAEREKLIILSDHSILSCKYDFITGKYSKIKRLFLQSIEKVQVGDFQYPKNSFMGSREHGGVRLSWNPQNIPKWAQKWNPFSEEIPSISYAHHPVIYNPKESDSIIYSVDNFIDSLEVSLRAELRMRNRPFKGVMVEEPIIIESYASMFSTVFNQSHLGFNRDRNGVSF